MEANIQGLVSQFYDMNAETIRKSSAEPTDGSIAPQMIDGKHRAQQETSEIFQNVIQAVSKSHLNHVPGSSSHQPTSTAILKPEIISYQRQIGTTQDESPSTAGTMLLIMSLTRTKKAVRVCSQHCSCHCHVQTAVKTPRILEQITGCLFLGYSGCPILLQRCILPCLEVDPEPLKITYYFPRWFVNRAVSFSMSSALKSSPALNIKIRRVVSEASQLFSLSKFGDVEGIRKLFQNGLASPDDIHFRGGWTALHVSFPAIFCSHIGSG